MLKSNEQKENGIKTKLRIKKRKDLNELWSFITKKENLIVCLHILK